MLCLDGVWGVPRSGSHTPTYGTFSHGPFGAAAAVAVPEAATVMTAAASIARTV